MKKLVYFNIKQCQKSEENILTVMNTCFEKSEEILEEDQINDILTYVGLKG